MTTAARNALTPPASVTPELVRRLGTLVASSGERTATSRHVFTGGPLAELPLSSVDDVRHVIATARAAQPAWAATPTSERARVLRRLVDLMHHERDVIADLIQAETGKARLHAVMEQWDPLLTAGYYARKAVTLLRPKRRAGLFPGTVAATELRVPRGVVGIIAPWNYPFALGLGDALAALVAGNAVVLKPDLQTSLSPLYAVDLMRRAGVPDDVFAVVLGDGPGIGGAVVDAVDYVGFTGSSRTGRDVARRTGSRLVGCSLELGGKNPMVVLGDADVDRTVGSAISGCFTNAGQLCLSIERIYVEQPVYPRFLERFMAAVSALKVGASYTDLDIDMGSLTSARHLETVTAHVDDARDKGATVHTGGTTSPELGPYFYQPTVLTGVTPEMTCYATETFGPVVSVYPVADEAEAIARANDTAYGLNASVFTRSVRRGRRVAAALRAGTVNINDGFAASYGSIDAPMGGVGISGLGRRHGAEGLLKYTEAQSVARLRLPLVDPPPYVSRQTYLRVVTGVLRWLGRARVR